MENFEQRLSRQSQKEIPSAWRAEILAAAHMAQAARHPSPVTRHLKSSRPSSILHFLSSLLWPHPKAWAGLAAVWLLILGLHVCTRDDSNLRVTTEASAPSPEMIVELKKQQRMFAEFIGPREERDVARSKTYAPRPRTQREEMAMV